MDEYIDQPEEGQMHETSEMSSEAAAEGEVKPQLSAAEKLAIIIKEPNIAAALPVERLGQIAQSVIDEYTIDKNSRSGWETITSEAMDLAMMISEQKDYPFEKAANVKYPLLTVAALQFNARAYPAIVQGDRVAKCKTQGRDPGGKKAARADRVSEHLSWQIVSEDPAWEEDTDKLLVVLPIVGCALRKVWFDPAVQKKRSRLISANDLVVNYYARSIEDVPRVTEHLRLYPYEIAERIRAGRFIDFKYDGAASEPQDDNAKQKPQADPSDKDAPQLFLEQHRLIDLDEDGYPEPYVVTVHHASQKVCRIAANFTEESVSIGQDGKVAAIRKQEYYVKYQFLPSPDGGFYGQGFGWLLKDTSESINTLLNMMMDAGHLSTVQGGLVSGSAGIKEKSIRIKPGEWRIVGTSSAKIGDAMMPIKYDGPSPVLFELLGLLVESGKEVASIKDVLTGDTPATAPVGTTLAIIEQGLQVFTSIYKRIHRALKKELALHARLNRDYLTPEKYNEFFDGEQVDPQADYANDEDIVPISDPNNVSKMQKLGKAQFLQKIAEENPTINQIEATKRLLEAAEIEDIDTLMLPPPQPDPEEEILKRKVAMNAVKKQESEILKDETSALKNIADASAAEEGQQLQMYQAFLAWQAAQNEAGDGQGRIPSMEGQSGNAMGSGAPSIDLGAGGNIPQGTPVPVAQPVSPGMGGPPAMGGP